MEITNNLFCRPKVSLILLLVLCFIINSCQNFTSEYLTSKKKWREEMEYTDKCYDQYNYYDLKQAVTARVLHFQAKPPKNFPPAPAFFITETKQHDTIGFLDYEFDSIVSIGDTVLFLPGKSRNDTINGYYTIGHYPMYLTSHRRKFNKILCTVKDVYYSNIELINY